MQRSTTDQRLLDSRGPTDWVHADPWRVLRIQAEFVEGFGTLAELGPAISVFGSARVQRDTPEYERARAVGAGLARAGYAVITGGGPGIMEAVNRGAVDAGGVSVGLGIELPFEQGAQPVGRHRRALPVLLRPQDDVRQVRARVHRASGRVRHDGRAVRGHDAGADAEGHGLPHRPRRVRTTGAACSTWLRDTMVAEGKASEQDLHLLQVVDDVDEAVALDPAAPRRTVSPLRQEELDAVMVKEEAERRAASNPLMGI